MEALTRPTPLDAALADDQSEEERLVAACRRGDETAFRRLVEQHQTRVFRLAARFFDRSEDREDVAQEVFLRAWRKLPTYRADAPFEHWLTRLCLNHCYSRLRSRRWLPSRRRELGEMVAPASDRDAPLAVASLLRRLRPEDRFVLVLLDGEGWSVEEIATRLGWSRSKVKVRAHRARKRLRDVLAEGL